MNHKKTLCPIIFFLITIITSPRVINAEHAFTAVNMLLLNGTNNFVSAQAHQAYLVGPLSSASISAVLMTSPDQVIEGPKNTIASNNVQTAGTFDLSLTSVNDDDWVVVSASLGSDIDNNGDRKVDAIPSPNQGTLHALAKASDWKTKYLRITPLTELAYRFTEHLFGQVTPDELSFRLQDVARYLIKEDIDGNAILDWNDILAFDPGNPDHYGKLATSYDWLSTLNSDGFSIIGSIQTDDVTKTLTLMDDVYNYLMTRFPAAIPG